MKSLSSWAVLSIFVASGAAMAASPKATQGAAPSTAATQSIQPQSTSATYGDWTVSCQRLTSSTGKPACEVNQYVRVQGLKDPVALIAFGYLPDSTALTLTVMTPNNVTLSEPPKAYSEASGGAAIELSWRRCIPGGCFAAGPVGNDALKAWRASREAGRIEYRDAAGQMISLPLSMNGYATALDALRRES